MREQDIRRILAHVCSELDSAARRSAGPAALGGALLVAAGCGADSSLYSAPLADGGSDAADSGSAALYSAPVVDSGTGVDAGTVSPVYSVPAVDAGPVTKYGVPVVDSGPVLDYMAPLVDAGAMPAYMAPAVDAGSVAPADAGPVAIYAVVS